MKGFGSHPSHIKLHVQNNQTKCYFTISEGGSKPAVNILIYDIKTNKLSKASQDFKYTHSGTHISYLLNDESVLVSGLNLHLPLFDNIVEKISFK